MGKSFDAIFTVVQHIILICVSVIAAVPLYSCVLTSFKTNDELVAAPFMSLPESGPNLMNYQKVFDSGYFNALIVTTVIVLFSVCLASLLNAMIAYALNRLKFSGKKVVIGLICLSSFVPAMIVQIYTFRIMAELSLINTLFGYIMVISNIDMVSIIIFERYFSSISTSIDEAAFLDGCSQFKVFFRIHLPLLRQAFFTVAIIRSIFVFNEYYIANIYLLDKAKYQTLTTMLNMFNTPYGYGTQYNVICAGVILAALPTVVIYVVFQKRIYNGLSSNINPDIS